MTMCLPAPPPNILPAQGMKAGRARRRDLLCLNSRARGRRVPWPIEKQQRLSRRGQTSMPNTQAGPRSAKVLTDVTRRKTSTSEKVENHSRREGWRGFHQNFDGRLVGFVGRRFQE